jgi:hypothetical protein
LDLVHAEVVDLPGLIDEIDQVGGPTDKTPLELCSIIQRDGLLRGRERERHQYC